MKIRRKHTFLVFLFNLILAELFLLLLSYPSLAPWQVFILVIPVVTIVSGLVIFLAWAFYVYRYNKEPGNKLFFYSNSIISLAIISIFGYSFIMTIYYRHYEANIRYNNEFFDYNMSPHDSLYHEAFRQVENKIPDKNDIRVEMYTTIPVDTVLNGYHDTVRYVYFQYTLNGNNEKLVSGHLAGLHINQLLFYNKTLADMPEVKEKFEKGSRVFMRLIKNP